MVALSGVCIQSTDNRVNELKHTLEKPTDEVINSQIAPQVVVVENVKSEVKYSDSVFVPWTTPVIGVASANTVFTTAVS